MKDEIKEILDKLRSDDYYEKEYQKSVYYERDLKKLEDYITNLQEENERLKEDMKIKDDIISITYNKDTKEYILDRKNYYKINKRLDERLDYKSRCEKANWWLKEMLKQARSDEAKAIINGTLELL